MPFERLEKLARDGDWDAQREWGKELVRRAGSPPDEEWVWSTLMTMQAEAVAGDRQGEAIGCARALLHHPGLLPKRWAYGAAQAFRDLPLAVDVMRSLGATEAQVLFAVTSGVGLPIERRQVTWSEEAAEDLRSFHAPDPLTPPEIDEEAIRDTAGEPVQWSGGGSGNHEDLIDAAAFSLLPLTGSQREESNRIRRGARASGPFVVTDPSMPPNRAIVGRPGNNYLEAGFVWAPYIPLQVTRPTIGLEEASRKKRAAVLILSSLRSPFGEVSRLLPDEDSNLLEGLLKCRLLERHSQGALKLGPSYDFPDLPAGPPEEWPDGTLRGRLRTRYGRRLLRPDYYGIITVDTQEDA